MLHFISECDTTSPGISIDWKFKILYLHINIFDRRHRFRLRYQVVTRQLLYQYDTWTVQEEVELEDRRKFRLQRLCK
jgi:hypothetical protein